MIYGVKNVRNKIKKLLREFDLENFGATKTGLLSSGEQSRVSLAKATINEPRLLLLDEPTASLDPSAARTIRDKIKKYATDSGAGVLWTSHNMQEITEVCDRVLLGAIILWSFLTRVQQGVMLPFLEDVWSRNFINYFSSPLKISEYVAGLVVASVATSVIGFLFVIILAGLAFGYNIFLIGIGLLPFILILFAFGIALGILATTIVLRFGPSAEWIIWPMVYILSPLSGVFYPISVLPGFLQTISLLLPPSYVFEGLRSVVISDLPISESFPGLAAGLMLAIIYLSFMYLLFLYNYRVILRKGLILRFNTETF